MVLLIITLWSKIILTVCVWALPLLVFSPACFRRIGIPALAVPLFGRLLGVAFAALAVMYAFGLAQAYRGEVPCATIWTGLVSNGGAAFLILGAAVRLEMQQDWTPLGRRIVTISGALAFLVFLGLAVPGLGLCGMPSV